MMYIKWGCILLLSAFSLGCSAAEINRDSCSGKPVDQFYSSYIVFDVIKYGGGLTTEAEAKDNISKHVTLLNNGFQFRRAVIERPSYSIRCYPVPPEGEVDVYRWSNFYGFELSRNSVEVIEVYDLDDKDCEPSYYLEVIGDQLWLLYDGWLYKMKTL